MIDGLQLFTSFMNAECKICRPDLRLAATRPCRLQLRTLLGSSGSKQSGYCYTGDALWKRDTCLQEIKLLSSLSMSKWGCYNRQPSKSSPKVLHSHFVFDTRVKIFVTSPKPIIFFNKSSPQVYLLNVVYPENLSVSRFVCWSEYTVKTGHPLQRSLNGTASPLKPHHLA